MCDDCPVDTDSEKPVVPDGWEQRDGGLHRELTFTNFSEAFAFMTRVAFLAERRDHHPDWSNAWNRVVIDLISHDVGKVTDQDRSFAGEINALIPS